ncbi:MAG: hypothetical protein LWX56_10790 [Ignavibacteria bacterium]|nr:hypothetical protein [Ignavibacteria bacterium]
MKKVIIVGAFQEIIELCENNNYRIEGIFNHSLTGEFSGYPILGADSDAERFFSVYKEIPVFLTPDYPHIRQKLARLYQSIGYRFCNLIAQSAAISRTAHLGTGIMVQHGVNISANANIGDFVRLNTFANVMHDSHVGAYSTIAPNAVLLGKVTVGSSCYIGSSATVLLGRTVGKSTTIWVRSVAVKNVAEGVTIAGNPASANFKTKDKL